MFPISLMQEIQSIKLSLLVLQKKKNFLKASKQDQSSKEDLSLASLKTFTFPEV